MNYINLAKKGLMERWKHEKNISNTKFGLRIRPIKQDLLKFCLPVAFYLLYFLANVFISSTSTVTIIVFVSRTLLYIFQCFLII